MNKFAFVIAVSAALFLSNSSAGQTTSVVPSTGGNCLPREWVQSADLILLGMHGGGGTDTALVLPNTRNSADVVGVAGRLARPAILLLAAYRSTVWDLSEVNGPIKAVYVSGYYSQGVTGIGSDVPLVFRRSANVGGPNPDVQNSPCPDLRHPSSRPEAMIAAIRIRRAFGKWPSAYYGSYEPFSFRIGAGPLPPYPRVPRIQEIRADGIARLGDDKMQRRFEANNRPLSADKKAELAEERRRERQGRRLLHIRWDRHGKIVAVEKELFGGDTWREQTSAN